MGMYELSEVYKLQRISPFLAALRPVRCLGRVAALKGKGEVLEIADTWAST